MTNVVTSSFVEGLPEADGRCYVRLRCIDSDGNEYTHEPLVDTSVVDSGTLLSQYVAQIDAALAAKEATAAALGAVDITWTKLEFRRKFTDAEWAAFLNFRATYEASELSAETKAAIRLGLSDFDLAQGVSRNDASAQAMLGLMVVVGLLTQQRVDEVLGG